MNKNILFVTFGYPDKSNRSKFLFSYEQVKALIKSKANSMNVDVLDLMPNKGIKNVIIDELFEDVRVIRIKYPSLKKCFHKLIPFKSRLKKFLKQNMILYFLILSMQPIILF